MKLPSDSTIASEKIKNYLLQWRAENDKSAFLARAGYGLEQWEILAAHLREQILSLEVDFVELTSYGEMYEIRGSLAGPNGVSLKVVTIWMTEHVTGQTKFITLFPDKKD
jgi:hypothetical protein